MTATNTITNDKPLLTEDLEFDLGDTLCQHCHDIVVHHYRMAMAMCECGRTFTAETVEWRRL